MFKIRNAEFELKLQNHVADAHGVGKIVPSCQACTELHRKISLPPKRATAKTSGSGYTAEEFTNVRPKKKVSTIAEAQHALQGHLNLHNGRARPDCDRCTKLGDQLNELKEKRDLLTKQLGMDERRVGVVAMIFKQHRFCGSPEQLRKAVSEIAPDVGFGTDRDLLGWIVRPSVISLLKGRRVNLMMFEERSGQQSKDSVASG